MKWFRWWNGTATDPKLRLIANRAKASMPEVVAVWAMLLERGSQAEQQGSIEGLDLELIDFHLGMEPGRGGEILKAMRDKGLVDGDNIANWSQRQPKREDDSHDRVARYRQKKRDGNARVTLCNAPEEIRGEEKREKTPPTPSRGFVPPSVSEVAAYCDERKNGINAAEFVAHYEANGWIRGKTKVKDWQACVRTWEARRRNEPNHAPASVSIASRLKDLLPADGVWSQPKHQTPRTA